MDGWMATPSHITFEILLNTTSAPGPSITRRPTVPPFLCTLSHPRYFYFFLFCGGLSKQTLLSEAEIYYLELGVTIPDYSALYLP